MWVTKLLIFPVKKRIFCPKTTKFGPKLAFLVNLGQAMQAFSVRCWLVGWWLWRAGCISQDTYLLYTLLVYGQNTQLLGLFQPLTIKNLFSKFLTKISLLSISFLPFIPPGSFAGEKCCFLAFTQKKLHILDLFFRLQLP